MIAANAGEQAFANFTNDFREMLLSFDTDAVFDAITSWARTEGVGLIKTCEDANDIQTVVELAFARLFNRGAISTIRPMSTAGQAQLDALLTMNRPTVVVTPANEITVDTVIADFNGRLSMSDFKRKCQSDLKYFALYEQAIEAGRV